jgi:hypothetical protein
VADEKKEGGISIRTAIKMKKPSTRPFKPQSTAHVHVRACLFLGSDIGINSDLIVEPVNQADQASGTQVPKASL